MASVAVWLVLACVSAAGWRAASGEMFTALVHMEGLVRLEGELLEGLNHYIQADRRRLQELEQFAGQVRSAMEKVEASNASQHLLDPVNSFQLLNRYTNGWMKLKDKVPGVHENARDLMANISVNQYLFPSEEDYTGAITALRRLQDTYQLTPGTIASGKIGQHQGLPLSSVDCYRIGRSAYLDDHWLHTRSWMLEALGRFDEEGEEEEELDLSSVFDHLSFAEYKMGNLKKAVQYTRELLQNEPGHERALANLRYFNEEMGQQHSTEEGGEGEGKGREGEGEGEKDEEHVKYESLCREAQPLPSEEHHKLTCFYYTSGGKPRLVLAPVKVELAHPNPPIYILHDILSDREMERLKELAAPKLNRATARNHITGQFEPVEYRISKSGWLSSWDDPLGYVSRIDQRIEDVTGLTMETAEQLQVVNYGIGGHYEPHYDFARSGEDAFSSLGTGNRIATMLFYMSDVELGGATVFPLLGARIAPVKGTAAFWWNLKRSGEGDYRTRHAACPVLVGTKWVCNKWIHESGQEFRRRCSLTPDL